MKTPVALLCSLAFALPLNAQTAGQATPPAQAVPKGYSAPEKAIPTDKAKAATKTTPATKTAPVAKTPDPKAKKEEPPAKIEGMEIPRGDRFLGIQIVNGVFKLSFYDAKKKSIAPDVARAVLRWDPKYKVGKESVVLNSDGKSLTSDRSIRPPYIFKLFIILFKEPGEGADAVASENYTIDFRG